MWPSSVKFLRGEVDKETEIAAASACSPRGRYVSHSVSEVSFLFYAQGD